MQDLERLIGAIESEEVPMDPRLAEVLMLHAQWLQNSSFGRRANLSRANLTQARCPAPI